MASVAFSNFNGLVIFFKTLLDSQAVFSFLGEVVWFLYCRGSFYSWTPVTRTLKENETQFEFERNLSYRDKFQWNFDQGKGKLVRVSGEFELSRFYWIWRGIEFSSLEPGSAVGGKSGKSSTGLKNIGERMEPIGHLLHSPPPFPVLFHPFFCLFLLLRSLVPGYRMQRQTAYSSLSYKS